MESKKNELVLINKETFSIEEYKEDYDQKKYFECDKLISNTIALLNKKGYITEFACAGHINDIYKQPFITFSEEKAIPQLASILSIFEFPSISKKGEFSVLSKNEKENLQGEILCSFRFVARFPTIRELTENDLKRIHEFLFNVVSKLPKRNPNFKKIEENKKIDNFIYDLQIRDVPNKEKETLNFFKKLKVEKKEIEK